MSWQLIITMVAAVTMATMITINPILYAEGINSKLTAYINSTRSKAVNAAFNQKAVTEKVSRIDSLCTGRIETATTHLNSNITVDNATADSDIAALKACHNFSPIIIWLH